MSNEIALEVRDITKTFPGTVALSGVNLKVRKGEVHAIVGENGAGKSTLMKVIDGIHKPDCGEILIHGENVEIHNPHDAQNFGIGFVHQEISLCQSISVTENIFISEIASNGMRMLDFNELNERAAEELRSFTDSIDPAVKVSDLSISNQQVVELVKALSRNCEIIIFDEPTAALTEAESETLFEIIRKLKEQGKSILYISHRMAEIFGNCDTVTILRDGINVGTFPVAEMNEDSIIKNMVGRELTHLYPPKADSLSSETEVLLEVENLTGESRFRNISFSLRNGEILGIAGLVGAGRSEMVQGMCGILPRICGDISLNGRRLEIQSYKDAIRNGIVYLTEDRKKQGLFLDLDIKSNIPALDIKTISNGIFISDKKETPLAERFMEALNIKAETILKKIKNLSGGNQQKVLIGKLLAVNPKIIIMDEPTRGIDVGAKSEIHALLRRLAGQGVGVIVISSELPEVVGLCDRVMVLHEGEITGFVQDEDINEEKIIELASGIVRSE